MTREARLTQIRLEGEILKLLEGESASLYNGDCAFCQKYKFDCDRCPLGLHYPDEVCEHPDFDDIDTAMRHHPFLYSEYPDAIPGALAIYMWLEEL